MAHVVAAHGYKVCPVRTGGESVIANFMPEMFATNAKGAGEVKKVTKDFIEIEYDDPELPIEVHFLGRRYGVVTGKTIPHDIVTDMIVGEKFKKGHVLTWNSGFFERDIIEEGGAIWKRGVPATVAFMDGPETIEDSCRISKRLSKELTINTTNVKEITASFKHNITNMLSVGDTVELDTIMLYLEDSYSKNDDSLFESYGLEALNSLARSAPKADSVGKINRIEVIYNGDIEDATPSVAKIITEADSERTKEAKRFKDGRVTLGQASDLPIDTLKIKFYIDNENDAADADKIVLGHQLKSVISSTLEGLNTTEDGEDIDIFFAYQGVNDRIVLNVIYNGMLIPLVEKANDNALDYAFEGMF